MNQSVQQPYPYPVPHQEANEIDLLELWNVLWGNKWIITCITSLFAVTSVIFALLQTDIYHAEAVLAPADTPRSGSDLSGQLGAAASLVGIDIGGQPGGSKVLNAIAIMESREFTRSFIATHEILVPLMASTWDSELGRNIIDPEIYNDETNTWLRDKEHAKPTDWEAYQRFEDIFSVSLEEEAGLVRLAIEWPDPQQAAEWVNWMVRDINAHIKQQDLEEANSAIAFLKKQLESTQLLEMQRVFYDLIESQTRVIMLADVREEYVFRVIDPAVVPEEEVRPKRALISILGTILGGLLAVSFVLIRNMVRNHSTTQD